MILLLLQLLYLINEGSSSFCGHFGVMQDISHLEDSPIKKFDKNQMTQNLFLNNQGSTFRIKTEFQPEFLKHSDVKNMKENVEKAISRIVESVRVRKPVSNKLLFQRTCKDSKLFFIKKGQIRTRYCSNGCATTTKCANWVLPEKYLQKCYYINGKTPSTSGTDGEGLQDVDLLLFVDRSDVSCRTSTVAWALSCQLEDDINRPILGGLNICENYFKQTSDYVKQQVLLHEILHVLGFSPSLYAFFHDELGNPRTPRNSITNLPSTGITMEPYLHYTPTNTVKTINMSYKSVHDSYSMPIKVIITPNVKREVKNHFGCLLMEGLYLEDLRNSIAHVEALYYQSNVMRSSINQVMYFTRIELALLQDSGWYIVDYSKADNLAYGKNLGCTFAQKGCLNYIDQQTSRGKPVYPYCLKYTLNDNAFRCNSDFNNKIACSTFKFNSDLPKNRQYFKNQPNFGGISSSKSNCPTIEFYSQSNCKDESVNTILAGKNYFIESFGKDSFCFPIQKEPEFFISNVKQSIQRWGSLCYKVECSEKSNDYDVLVDQKRYKCKSPGQIHKINGQISNTGSFNAIINCPDFSYFCRAKNISLATPLILENVESSTATTPLTWENSSEINDTTPLIPENNSTNSTTTSFIFRVSKINFSDKFSTTKCSSVEKYPRYLEILFLLMSMLLL